MSSKASAVATLQHRDRNDDTRKVVKFYSQVEEDSGKWPRLQFKGEERPRKDVAEHVHRHVQSGGRS